MKKEILDYIEKNHLQDEVLDAAAGNPLLYSFAPVEGIMSLDHGILCFRAHIPALEDSSFRIPLTPEKSALYLAIRGKKEKGLVSIHDHEVLLTILGPGNGQSIETVIIQDYLNRSHIDTIEQLNQTLMESRRSHMS